MGALCASEKGLSRRTPRKEGAAAAVPPAGRLENAAFDIESGRLWVWTLPPPAVTLEGAAFDIESGRLGVWASPPRGRHRAVASALRP